MFAHPANPFRPRRVAMPECCTQAPGRTSSASRAHHTHRQLADLAHPSQLSNAVPSRPIAACRRNSAACESARRAAYVLEQVPSVRASEARRTGSSAALPISGRRRGEVQQSGTVAPGQGWYEDGGLRDRHANLGRPCTSTRYSGVEHASAYRGGRQSCPAACREHRYAVGLGQRAGLPVQHSPGRRHPSVPDQLRSGSSPRGRARGLLRRRRYGPGLASAPDCLGDGGADFLGIWPSGRLFGQSWPVGNQDWGPRVGWVLPSRARARSW